MPDPSGFIEGYKQLKEEARPVGKDLESGLQQSAAGMDMLAANAAMLLHDVSQRGREGQERRIGKAIDPGLAERGTRFLEKKYRSRAEELGELAAGAGTSLGSRAIQMVGALPLTIAQVAAASALGGPQAGLATLGALGGAHLGPLEAAKGGLGGLVLGSAFKYLSGASKPARAIGVGGTAGAMHKDPLDTAAMALFGAAHKGRLKRYEQAKAEQPMPGELLIGEAEYVGPVMWHGTGSRPYSKVSRGKAFSGTGATTEGVGYYMAEEHMVGKKYQEWLAPKPDPSTPRGLAAQYMRDSGTPAQAIKKLNDTVRYMQKKHDLKGLRKARLAQRSILDGTYAGGLAKVRPRVIPDKQLLDLDKPLNQQPIEVKKALAKAGWDPEAIRTVEKYDPRIPHNFRTPPVRREEMTGRDLYDEMVNETHRQIMEGYEARTGKIFEDWTGELGQFRRQAHRDVTNELHEAGIVGTRYLDLYSKGKGRGTRNIVMFEPERIKVLEWNGKPVK